MLCPVSTAHMQPFSWILAQIQYDTYIPTWCVINYSCPFGRPPLLLTRLANQRYYSIGGFCCKLKQLLSPCIAGGLLKDCYTNRKFPPVRTGIFIRSMQSAPVVHTLSLLFYTFIQITSCTHQAVWSTICNLNPHVHHNRGVPVGRRFQKVKICVWKNEKSWILPPDCSYPAPVILSPPDTLFRQVT